MGKQVEKCGASRIVNRQGDENRRSRILLARAALPTCRFYRCRVGNETSLTPPLSVPFFSFFPFSLFTFTSLRNKCCWRSFEGTYQKDGTIECPRPSPLRSHSWARIRMSTRRDSALQNFSCNNQPRLQLLRDPAEPNVDMLDGLGLDHHGKP